MPQPIRQNPQRAKPVNPRAIGRRRVECLDRIERLRALNGAAAPFVIQAQRMLLPRYWAKASWRKRAETLAMAEWFLRMGEGAQGGIDGDFEQGISVPCTGDEAPSPRVLLNAKA